MEWYLILLALLPCLILLLGFLFICCCHEIEYNGDFNCEDSTTATIVSDVERGNLQNPLQTLPAIKQLPSYKNSVRRQSASYIPDMQLYPAHKYQANLLPSLYRNNWPPLIQNREVSSGNQLKHTASYPLLRRTSYPPNLQIKLPHRSGSYYGENMQRDSSPIRVSYPYARNTPYLRSASYSPTTHQPQYTNGLPPRTTGEFYHQNQDFGEDYWYSSANSRTRRTSDPIRFVTDKMPNISHSYNLANTQLPSSKTPYLLKPRDTIYI